MHLPKPDAEQYRKALRNVTRRVYEDYLERAKRQLDQATYEVTYWTRALEAMDQVELALEVDVVMKASAPPPAGPLPSLS